MRGACQLRGTERPVGVAALGAENNALLLLLLLLLLLCRDERR